MKSYIAIYSGDSNFMGSTSVAYLHRVGLTEFSIQVNSGFYRTRALYSNPESDGRRYAGTFHSQSLTATVTAPIGGLYSMVGHGLSDISCGAWARGQLYTYSNYVSCERTVSSPSTTTITARDVSQCGGEGCFPYYVDFYFSAGSDRTYLRAINPNPMPGIAPQVGAEIDFIDPDGKGVDAVPLFYF